MITFMIDEFTPCLKDCETGEIFHTEVIKLTPADVRKTKKSLGRFPKLPFPGYNTYKQAKTETK